MPNNHDKATQPNFELNHHQVKGHFARYELNSIQLVDRPISQIFEFFSDAKNLETLTPPWLSFKILEAPATLNKGSMIRYQLRLYGIYVRWLTEISSWDPPHSFSDIQRRGPYSIWEHTHQFTAKATGTEISDHVVYELPIRPIAPLIRSLFVKRQLDKLFTYRAQRIAELFNGD